MRKLAVAMVFFGMLAMFGGGCTEQKTEPGVAAPTKNEKPSKGGLPAPPEMPKAPPLQK